MIQAYLFHTAELTPAALARVPRYRRERAEKAFTDQARRQCLGAGLLMKDVLGVESEDDLTYGAQGKPLLQGRFFNLSHDGDFVALCTADSQIGVDLLSPRPVHEGILRRCAAPEETVFVCGDEARFTWLFSRKEAVVKADGRGLALDLRCFSVLEDACLGFSLQSVQLPCGWLSVATKEPEILKIREFHCGAPDFDVQ